MAGNIWDYYTMEDCMTAADIWTTFDSGYCPVAIKAPDQVTDRWGITYIPIDENVCEDKFYRLYINYKPMTLKLAFAIKVWRLAHVVVKKLYRNNCEWKFDWQKRDESFNQLVPFRTDIGQFVENFYKAMKYICDKKMVTVSEGYWLIDRFSQNDRHDMSSSLYEPRAIVVLHSIDNLEAFEFLDYHYDKTQRIFSWEEIKDLFVEVTIPQLELLHGEKINRMEAGDEMLFEACHNLDLEGIKQAIQEGANPKALDKFGQSTIYQCVDTCVNYCGMSEIDAEEEEEFDYEDIYDGMESIMGLNDEELLSRTKACIEFLMEQGVDINLFGYGCAIDVLYTAVHYNTSELMKYLLEKGAIPNFNSDVEDIVKSNKGNWYIKSMALNHLYDDIGADELTDARYEMERLLNEYGAELYIDGYEDE